MLFSFRFVFPTAAAAEISERGTTKERRKEEKRGEEKRRHEV